MGNFYDDQEQKNIISKNLLLLIETTDKRQADIAIDLNVNPPTFNQWVNGKAVPSISMLKRLAAYFKVPLTSIVDPHDDFKDIQLTQDEINLIIKYRQAPKSVKDAVGILLNHKED